MKDDLFPGLSPALSPRLQWVNEQKAAGMLTYHFDSDDPPWMCVLPVDGYGKGECDSSQGELMANYARFYDESGLIGEGESEIDAMEDCAIKNGIKLWNEA